MFSLFCFSYQTYADKHHVARKFREARPGSTDCAWLREDEGVAAPNEESAQLDCYGLVDAIGSARAGDRKLEYITIWTQNVLLVFCAISS